MSIYDKDHTDLISMNFWTQSATIDVVLSIMLYKVGL